MSQEMTSWRQIWNRWQLWNVCLKWTNRLVRILRTRAHTSTATNMCVIVFGHSKWTTHRRCLLYWRILSYLASNVPSQYCVKWGCTALVSLVSRIWQVMWWILFFINVLFTFSCLFYPACRYREPRPVSILLSEWTWWIESQVPHGKRAICPHIMYNLKELCLILP